MTAKKPDHLLLKKRRLVDAEHKQCKECEAVKHLSEFHRSRRFDREEVRWVYAARCKPCSAEQNRIRLYGVTLAEMIAKQGSAICPLCKKRLVDSLDHDHKTGQPRGALCRKCNLIMHYMDDREWVARAEEYRKGVDNSSA